MGGKGMRQVLAMALAVGGLDVTVVPCAAQTGSVQAPSQNPASQVPSIPGVSVPGVPGAATTAPSTVPAPAIQGSLPRMSFGLAPGGVGQGLPGMSGGPPVNRPMGAGDPSARYMVPPVVQVPEVPPGPGLGSIP